ncbi:MAG: sulfatase [Planctomycetes bacterium]|nr:sulfatase [Planctomycetota bacterium]
MSALWTLVLLAAVACRASAPNEPRRALPKRPNILFILSDDHAAHALSCYGSAVNATPNLDRLASGGLRFDRAFVTNSICTPSRASLLTGQYSHVNGVPVFNRFDGARDTVAKRLSAAGYHTGMIGKWHLGGEPTGFDVWDILPGQGVYVDPTFVSPAGRRVVPGHVTDVITERGLEFLETRPKDRPFFLMLHHKAPHREWTPAERHRARWAGRVVPEPSTLFDDGSTRTDALRENRQTIARDLNRFDLKLVPSAAFASDADRRRWFATAPQDGELDAGDGNALRGDALTRWKYQRYMQDYLACVQGVDESVGRVLDWLDAHGLAEDTLVVYSSDNGFFLGDHGLYDKRFMYEESLRVPLLARWPGAIEAGGTTDALVLNLDLPETFLELAGLEVPREMQGRSLAPFLAGEEPRDWRTSFYYRYYHDPGDHDTRAHYGVRTRTHKLVHYWTKGQWELFDLVNDPRELVNLAGRPEHAETFEALKRELERVKRAVGDEDQFAGVRLPYGAD